MDCVEDIEGTSYEAFGQLIAFDIESLCGFVAIAIFPVVLRCMPTRLTR